MPSVDVAVTGARELGIRFDKFPDRARENLIVRITGLTDRLAERIRNAAPNRSGKLRSEIESAVFSDQKDKIVGTVFVDGADAADFAKAGALEYGAHGTAKLTAHEMQLSHVFSRKLAAPLAVLVNAHQRQLDIVARQFVRGPASEMRSGAFDELQQAVDDAAADDTT